VSGRLPAVDLFMDGTMPPAPRDGPLASPLVVAELEPHQLTLIRAPHDQIEVGVGESPSLALPGDLTNPEYLTKHDRGRKKLNAKKRKIAELRMTSGQRP
jgi:hypothetical protein